LLGKGGPSNSLLPAAL
jgi:hypothetical protein